MDNEKPDQIISIKKFVIQNIKVLSNMFSNLYIFQLNVILFDCVFIDKI